MRKLAMRVLKASLAVGLFAAAASFAQDAPAAPAPDAGAVEEIVVVSRQREESIQEVPIAVSAFNTEAIADLAPATLRDFDGLTPNLFIGMNTAGPGASAIYVRGLGYADIEKTQTPNVGVVIDGVFVPSSTGQLIDTFDIQSLEVNRGPQAILWGRNTSGGTIVVRRGAPDSSEFDAKARISYGDYVGGEGDGGALRIQGVANFPLVQEKLALRVGYTYKSEDGYYRNERNGDSRGEIDYNALSAKLLWTPTEDISLQLNHDWIKDRSDIPPQDPRFDGRDPFINRTDRSPEEAAPYNVNLTSLEFTWETPVGKLTSISAYWNSDDTVFQDFDGGFADLANPANNDPNLPLARLHTTRAQDFDVFSQEIRLQGGLFDERLLYTAGFYYSSEDLDFEQRSEQIAQLPPALLPFGGTCGPFALGPIDTNFGFGQLCTGPPSRSQQLASQDAKSWALFGSLEFSITDAWNVSGGLRWINEEKDFSNSYFNINSITKPFTVTGTFVPRFELSDDWDQVVFEVGTDYQLTEDVLGYFRFAQGFRSGGFSIRQAQPIENGIPCPPGSPTATLAQCFPTAFDPEDTDQVELGVKTGWFDRRVTVNFAGFWTQVKGAQASSILTVTPSSPGTTTVVINHDRTRIYGLELETSVEVVEGFNAYFTLGWQKGRLMESLQDGHNLPISPGGRPGAVGAPPIAFEDLPLTRVPELSWSVGANYRQAMGPGEVIADLRYRRQDEHFLIAPITPAGAPAALNIPVFQTGYSLFDASLAYEFELAERTVRAGFVGKNLTNKKYLEQALPLGVAGFQGWGAPRYVGGELTVEY